MVGFTRRVKKSNGHTKDEKIWITVMFVIIFVVVIAFVNIMVGFIDMFSK